MGEEEPLHLSHRLLSNSLDEHNISALLAEVEMEIFIFLLRNTWHKSLCVEKPENRKMGYHKWELWQIDD